MAYTSMNVSPLHIPFKQPQIQLRVCNFDMIFVLTFVGQLQCQEEVEHRHCPFFLILEQNPLCFFYIMIGKLSLFLHCAVDKPMTSVKCLRKQNKQKSLLEMISSIYLRISYLTLNVCFSTIYIMKVIKFPEEGKNKSYWLFRCIAK